MDDDLKGLGEEILRAGRGIGSGGGGGLGVHALKSLVMLFCFFNGFAVFLTLPKGLDDCSWCSPFVILIFASNARLLQFVSGGIEGVMDGSATTVAVKHALEGCTLVLTHPVPQWLTTFSMMVLHPNVSMCPWLVVVTPLSRCLVDGSLPRRENGKGAGIHVRVFSLF